MWYENKNPPCNGHPYLQISDPYSTNWNNRHIEYLPGTKWTPFGEKMRLNIALGDFSPNIMLENIFNWSPINYPFMLECDLWAMTKFGKILPPDSPVTKPTLIENENDLKQICSTE